MASDSVRGRKGRGATRQAKRDLLKSTEDTIVYLIRNIKKGHRKETNPMASKDDYNYQWAKVYAVQTHVNNEVKEGDEITVDDRSGGSPQKVLSVTTMENRSGRPYKVLLLKSLENKEERAERRN